MWTVVYSLAISISMLAGAIGSLSCAAYSTFCTSHSQSSLSLLKCPCSTDGRRSVYMTSLPLMCAGSLVVALSREVPELMVWRFVQSFSTSAGLSVGSGVIGDIYKLEERYSLLTCLLCLIANRFCYKRNSYGCLLCGSSISFHDILTTT